MTHEHRPHAEAEHGPEHTHDLPDAAGIAVYALAEDSDLPPLPDEPAGPEVGDTPGPRWW